MIDGDRFAGAKVDRLQNVGTEDQIDSFDAVVDVHETAGLIAAAPNFDFMLSGEFCFHYFSADGRGRFFPAAIPRAPGTVDVVEAGYTGFQAEVFAEVPAHSFGKEFFPAVAVFGEGRVSVFFLE